MLHHQYLLKKKLQPHLPEKENWPAILQLLLFLKYFYSWFHQLNLCFENIKIGLLRKFALNNPLHIKQS
jgi:hypothetical protein